MKVQLTVTEGPYSGKVFVLDNHDIFKVGRGTEAHFQIEQDAYFSRLHFIVEVNPPHCRLIDQNSSNGTYVNDRRMAVCDLKNGDIIRGGDTAIEVHLMGEAGEPTILYPPSVAQSIRLPTEPPEDMDHSTIISVRTPVSLPQALPLEGVSLNWQAGQTTTCLSCGLLSQTVSNPPICPDCTNRIKAQKLPSIPGYLIMRQLGRGGMGEVFLGVSHRDSRRAALKMILTKTEVSQQELTRFMREIEILRSLRHPHIISFHKLGLYDKGVYLAMDYVEGQDANRLLKAGPGPIAVERAVRWTCEVLEALQYAHELGYVHRDVKPENVLITGSDPNETALLADFGLARIYRASTISGLTKNGEGCGTWCFTPPEQVDNARFAGPTSDIFATAATLYRLLTRKYIYDPPKTIGQEWELAKAARIVPLQQRRPDLPPDLVALIERGLCREPDQRFPSAAEMRQAPLPYS